MSNRDLIFRDPIPVFAIQIKLIIRKKEGEFVRKRNKEWKMTFMKEE